jgi:hypothetical protein
MSEGGAQPRPDSATAKWKVSGRAVRGAGTVAADYDHVVPVARSDHDHADRRPAPRFHAVVAGGSSAASCTPECAVRQSWFIRLSGIRGEWAMPGGTTKAEDRPTRRKLPLSDGPRGLPYRRCLPV